MFLIEGGVVFTKQLFGNDEQCTIFSTVIKLLDFEVS